MVKLSNNHSRLQQKVPKSIPDFDTLQSYNFIQLILFGNFGARYEDKVKIRYDFDKDILKYGIIRNLFQPLIENYFVHGFDTSNEENYILFKGKSLDDKTMILTVEDNGTGMSDEEIKQLNAKLHEPIQISTESYGLKNLHQRLQLFYGESCGLTVCQNLNTPKGLCIQMTALKITCEEYNENKKNMPPHP